MRAALDYGCVAYMSAAETNLNKLDVEQAKALRICSRAFKTSPVSAMLVSPWGNAITNSEDQAYVGVLG